MLIEFHSVLNVEIQILEPKVLLRKPSNQEIIDSFKTIHASGIAFSANLIIGFPGRETRELVMETVELVKQIKGYDTITVSIFTL